jgi:hypothetical protein
MRERVVEKYFRDEVKKAGGKTRKCVWPGTNGCPDRVVLWEGRLYGNETGRLDWVEMKRPETPEAEDHQLRRHTELRDAGQTVFVLPTKEDVDRYVALRSTKW